MSILNESSPRYKLTYSNPQGRKACESEYFESEESAVDAIKLAVTLAVANPDHAYWTIEVIDTFEACAILVAREALGFVLEDLR